LWAFASTLKVVRSKHIANPPTLTAYQSHDAALTYENI
jgi:hypothetical protein